MSDEVVRRTYADNWPSIIVQAQGVVKFFVVVSFHSFLPQTHILERRVFNRHHYHHQHRLQLLLDIHHSKIALPSEIPYQQVVVLAVKSVRIDESREEILRPDRVVQCAFARGKNP